MGEITHTAVAASWVVGPMRNFLAAPIVGVQVHRRAKEEEAMTRFTAVVEEAAANKPVEVEGGIQSPAGEDAREQLLVGLPVTERRLQLAGVPTAVLEGGDGPPVILLHGPGEYAAKWMRVIPDLVTTHRVVAPDLPGHGSSGVPDGPLDADRVLEWLDELIDQTCTSPPALVGHLLGGAIAARFASGHGDRLSRLVLVGALGLGRFRPAPSFALALIRHVARPTERTHDRLWQRCTVDLDGVREQMGENWESFAAYNLDRARTPNAKSALRTLMGQLGVPPIPPADLERISVPTTLIWGRHNLAIRLRVGEAASARYGWPLHVIEKAADDPPIEQPEAFLRALHTALGTTVTNGTS
jgi:pimeloyl-ACP methyl ester carboxylesterase